MDRNRIHGKTSADKLRDTTPASPLYLAPAHETWVGLDGPALRVSTVERADRCFPLRRIGRIHTNQRVQWDMNALMACADAGIPIVFMNDEGQVQARLLGRPGARDEMRNRLVEFLLRPESQGMLRHWFETNDQRASHWVAVKLGLGAQTATPANVRDWLNQRAERHAGPRAAELTRQWLRGLAYTWMESHLHDLGFGLSTELGQAGAPPLAAELTDIFHWYLEPVHHGWLKRRYLTALRKRQSVLAPTQVDVIRLFESNAMRAAARGREITSSLHRWLIHET